MKEYSGIVVFALALLASLLFLLTIILAGLRKGELPTPDPLLKLMDWCRRLNVILLANFGVVIGLVLASGGTPFSSLWLNSASMGWDKIMQDLACIIYLLGLLTASVFYFFIKTKPDGNGKPLPHLPFISELTDTFGALAAAALALLLGVKD